MGDPACDQIGRAQRSSRKSRYSVIPERGIKDLADLYAIGEASEEVLLRNAEMMR